MAQISIASTGRNRKAAIRHDTVNFLFAAIGATRNRAFQSPLLHEAAKLLADEKCRAAVTSAQDLLQRRDQHRPKMLSSTFLAQAFRGVTSGEGVHLCPP